MELKLDPEQFDELQVPFIRAIVEKVHIKALEAGLTGEQLQRVTSEIAFSIASAIDDTAAIETDGVAVRPYLTFRNDNDELIHSGENSETHEYVTSILKQLLSG